MKPKQGKHLKLPRPTQLEFGEQAIRVLGFGVQGLTGHAYAGYDLGSKGSV